MESEDDSKEKDETEKIMQGSIEWDRIRKMWTEYRIEGEATLCFFKRVSEYSLTDQPCAQM